MRCIKLEFDDAIEEKAFLLRNLGKLQLKNVKRLQKYMKSVLGNEIIYTGKGRDVGLVLFSFLTLLMYLSFFFM